MLSSSSKFHPSQCIILQNASYTPYRRPSQPCISPHQIYDFNESRILCELALVGRIPLCWLPLSACLCQTFATAKTIPLTKPTDIALTLASVTGTSKNTRPETAMGSLLSAPTIEYVVLLVTRTQLAEAYDMRMDERPVKIIAETMYVLEPSGKLSARLAADQFSRNREHTNSVGRESRLL